MTQDLLVDVGRGRRIAHRCGHAALWIVGIAGALALAAAVALVAFVLHGPIRADAAARAAEEVLADLAGPGARARIASAHLDWSLADGLSVDLADIVVDRGAGLAVDLPRATLTLRLLPMLVGDVRPAALVLHDPRIAVDTALLAGSAETATPSDHAWTPPAPAPGTAAAPAFTRAAEILGLGVARAVGVAHDRGFRSFALRGGRLAVAHRNPDGTQRTVTLRDLSLEAVVDGPAGDLDALFSASGDVGRWSVRLTRAPRQGGGHRLVLTADDVTLHDLLGPPSATFVLDMPLYPRLSLAWDGEDRFAGADLDLHSGAGVFRFGKEREDEVVVDEARVEAGWLPDERVFAIRSLGLSVGETWVGMTGRITPPPEPLGVWGIDLAVDQGALRPRDVGGAAVPFRASTIQARWDGRAKALEITKGALRFGNGALDATLRLDVSGDDPRLQADLVFSTLSTAEVARAWPHWVAPGARAWFVRAVSAGRVLDTRIRLDMPNMDRPEGWPGNAFLLTGRFEGLRFDPLGNLPPIAGADGRFQIADRRFEAVVDRAHVATRAGRHPSVDAFRFQVVDIFAKPPRASVRFQTAGDVAALAEIADAEPLAVLQQAGIAAAGLSGTGSVAATVDVTFAKVVDAKSVDYRIEATLDGFASTAPIQGRRFQDGKFRIVADKAGLDVAGRAVVDGVPADVHVFEAREGSRASEKRDFKMTLDAAARQRLGLDLGGMVDGAVGLSVSQPNPNELRSRIEADLGAAKLVLAPVGWTKGAGVPAKATFDLWDDDKGLHIDNFALDSEGLSIRGNLLLDRDRAILSADFSRLTLRKGDVARLKMTRGADKVLTVALDATQIDVRGLLQANRRPAVPGETTTPGLDDLILRVKAAKAIGFNDIALTDVTLDGRYKTGAFGQLDLRARSTERRPLSVTIKPEAAHRRFTVASEDAGGVLSFLDLFDRIKGGTLTLSARLGDPGTSEGMLRLVDFRLLEEPKTGRAVASRDVGDGTRQIQVRRAEIDRSTDFDRASVRFAMREGIVNVHEMIAKGTAVGATASGQIDLGGQRIQLSGTYIPAYGLNNLAGRIPLIGAIAGAGSNEGLVGVTFRVVGAVDDPILQINPLSAVAPGIFRKIFEFQNDEMAPSGDTGAPTRITPGGGAPTRITP